MMCRHTKIEMYHAARWQTMPAISARNVASNAGTPPIRQSPSTITKPYSPQRARVRLTDATAIGCVLRRTSRSTTATSSPLSFLRLAMPTRQSELRALALADELDQPVLVGAGHVLDPDALLVLGREAHDAPERADRLRALLERDLEADVDAERQAPLVLDQDAAAGDV